MDHCSCYLSPYSLSSLLPTSLGWCELYLIFGNLFRKLNLIIRFSGDSESEFSFSEAGVADREAGADLAGREVGCTD